MRYLAIAVCALSCAASAETFVLRTAPETLADWKDGGHYVGGTAPSGAATDTIVTLDSANLRIGIDASTEEGLAVVGFLNSVKDLVPSNAVLSVTVPEGAVVRFDLAIHDNSSRTGTIEKDGDGELFLASRLRLSSSSTTVADYECNLHVRRGTVRLTDAAEQAHMYHVFHAVTIDSPGKVVTLANACVWQMRGLYGDGTITNEAASACTLYVANGPHSESDGGEFSGVIGGNVALQARSCRLTLSGTNSTFSGGVSGAYTTGLAPSVCLADFGEKSRAGSSAGVGTTALDAGARLVYIGPGQTTDRDLQVNGRSCVLDAGTNGNFVYKGKLRRWSSTRQNPCLFLAGDNALRSVFAPYGEESGDSFGEFERTVDGQAVTYNYYFGKRGTGEWHFPVTGRFRNTGVFAVENGVLSFESIDRAGELTALGYSTNLYGNVAQPSEDARVPYAFLLGSDNAEETGLMSCTTNLARQCTDRPFGLKGRGGFLADGGVVKYANVFGVGAGAKTLVLAGSNEGENEVHDVADGDGVVSVEKNGPNTWVLGGDQTFSGSLAVNGGTLVVRRAPQAYRRYRLMVMEVASQSETLGGGRSDSHVSLHISEIGLYSADGARQNLNLKYNPAFAALRPGECSLGLNRVIEQLTSGPYNVYELLFDGYRKRFNDEGKTSATWHAISGNSFSFEGLKGKREKMPIFGESATYLPFDMYLADAAQPIDHFDIMITSPNNASIPSAVQLQASVDGVHWDEVSAVERISQIPASYPLWLSTMTGGGYSDDGKPSDVIESQTRASGWRTVRTAPTREFSLLGNVGAVTVANGAALRYEGEKALAPTLSRVRLAAGATGSIDGFAFAEDGVFEIDAMPRRGCVDVAVALPNAEGLGNVSKWQVKVGGKLKTACRVSATPAGFTVGRRGMAVVVR